LDLARKQAFGNTRARFSSGKPLGQRIYTFSWCYRREYYSILSLHRVPRDPQAHRVGNEDRSKTRGYDTRRRDSSLREPSRPSTILHRVEKHAYHYRAAADTGKGRVLLLVVEAPLGALPIAPHYYRTRRNAPYPRAIRMRYT